MLVTQKTTKSRDVFELLHNIKLSRTCFIENYVSKECVCLVPHLSKFGFKIHQFCICFNLFLTLARFRSF